MIDPIPGVIYESPVRFTFKQRVSLCLAPPLISGVMKTLWAITRHEIRGEENYTRAIQQYGGFIMPIWHESTALGVCWHRNSGYHALASYSYDAEIGVRVLKRFGIPSVRGSSSRGGSEALKSLQRVLAHGRILGFTMDGPRGPRRVAKPGVAILAARTHVPILPLAFSVGPAWRLHSWDRFPIPKPFARVIGAYGEIIAPPPSESPEDIEAARLRIETALNALHEQLDAELGA